MKKMNLIQKSKILVIGFLAFGFMMFTQTASAQIYKADAVPVSADASSPAVQLHNYDFMSSSDALQVISEEYQGQIALGDIVDDVANLKREVTMKFYKRVAVELNNGTATKDALAGNHAYLLSFVGQGDLIDVDDTQAIFNDTVDLLKI